jgi:hypothetical protein
VTLCVLNTIIFRREATIVYFQDVTAGDVVQQYLPVEDYSSEESESSCVLEGEMRSSGMDMPQVLQEISSDNTFRELFMSG